MHPGSVAFEPLALGRGQLVGERRDEDVAGRYARGCIRHQSQFDRRIRLVHQQRLRRPFGRDALAVDCDDALADLSSMPTVFSGESAPASQAATVTSLMIS